MPLILLAMIHAASAACPADAPALRAELDAGFAAHQAQDWRGFERSVAAVHEDIGCLTEPVDVPLAGRLHHLLALYFAHHEDQANARDALRGALSLDGSFALDPSLTAAYPLLADAWREAVKKGPGDDRALPEGAWIVDGRPDADAFPTERATLVQRQPDQTALRSWYVFGGQIPPELLPRVAPTEATAASGGHLSRPLLFAGLAGLAAAAGGLSWAELNWAATVEGDPSAEEALDRYERAHRVSIGSTALGAVGGGLVVGAVIVGRW